MRRIWDKGCSGHRNAQGISGHWNGQNSAYSLKIPLFHSFCI